MRRCPLSTVAVSTVMLAVFDLNDAALPNAHAEHAPPPTATDPDTEIARRHFTQGTSLYNEEKYAEAILEFEAARRVKPLPAFDFNIARAHDRMEHVREAIDAYQRFVTGAPNDPDAAEVRSRIAVLKQRITEGAPAVPPVEPPHHRHYTWIVGGVGAALLVGSLVAGLVANARYGDLKSNCGPDGACDAVKVPQAQNWIDSARTAEITSDALLGIGAAAIIAGALLFFVEGRQPVQRQAWRISPTVDAHGAGLTFAVSQ